MTEQNALVEEPTVTEENVVAEPSTEAADDAAQPTRADFTKMVDVSLMDPYTAKLYQTVKADLMQVFKSITFGGEHTLSSMLGEVANEQVTNIILNQVTTPLIDALSANHATLQVINTKIAPVIKRDMVLHKIPDIFLLDQQLAQMRRNAEVYFNSDHLYDTYPSTDGWSDDLVALERYCMQRDTDNGVVLEENDVPFRDEPISIVTLAGVLIPNARYVNFSYIDNNTRTQEVTDIPAFWNVDKGEFLVTAAIALWKHRVESIEETLDYSQRITGDDITAALDSPVKTGDAITRGIFDANNSKAQAVTPVQPAESVEVSDDSATVETVTPETNNAAPDASTES